MACLTKDFGLVLLHLLALCVLISIIYRDVAEYVPPAADHDLAQWVACCPEQATLHRWGRCTFVPCIQQDQTVCRTVKDCLSAGYTPPTYT
jgi:hypothetical protein